MKDKEYDEVEEDREEDAPFTLFSDPSRLLHADMIWDIVLGSEVPEVYKEATRFLICMYMAIDDHCTRL